MRQPHDLAAAGRAAGRRGGQRSGHVQQRHDLAASAPHLLEVPDRARAGAAAAPADLHLELQALGAVVHLDAAQVALHRKKGRRRNQ